VRIHLCGVRGSTPAPGPEFVRYGGHTSSVALAHDGSASPTLILDAGTGLRRVTGLLGGQAFTGTILLTHLHWDHVHGLPFFVAAIAPARVTPLLPEQVGWLLAADVLARGMSPPHFPIGPEGLRGTGRSA
jgi:phosphoribosyl 1,2-cyclic phosphodiesterase